MPGQRNPGPESTIAGLRGKRQASVCSGEPPHAKFMSALGSHQQKIAVSALGSHAPENPTYGSREPSTYFKVDGSQKLHREPWRENFWEPSTYIKVDGSPEQKKFFSQKKIFFWSPYREKCSGEPPATYKEEIACMAPDQFWKKNFSGEKKFFFWCPYREKFFLEEKIFLKKKIFFWQKNFPTKIF